jgi:hypothetical protein
MRFLRFMAKVLLGLILACIVLIVPLSIPGILRLLAAAALFIATVFELGLPFFFWW